jgi:plasmid stabilization system protein ParE
LKIFWTEQALVRLSEIQDFIARANPDAAERLVRRIAERGEGLSKFPEMGRMVPECWLSRSLVIHRRLHPEVGQRWFA